MLFIIKCEEVDDRRGVLCPILQSMHGGGLSESHYKSVTRTIHSHLKPATSATTHMNIFVFRDISFIDTKNNPTCGYKSTEKKISGPG